MRRDKYTLKTDLIFSGSILKLQFFIQLLPTSESHHHARRLIGARI